MQTRLDKINSPFDLPAGQRNPKEKAPEGNENKLLIEPGGLLDFREDNDSKPSGIAFSCSVNW